MVIVTAIQQQPYYKGLLNDFWAVSLAISSLGPAIEQTVQQLKNDDIQVRFNALQRAIADLPQWQSRLRKGATSAVQQSMLAVCQQLVQRLHQRANVADNPDAAAAGEADQSIEALRAAKL
eukprot:1866829-Lingulodinium_polyedra.AAC.1